MTIIRRISRLAAGIGVASGAVILLAGPAAATHTDAARARAAYIELLGAPVLDTGHVVASNDGFGGGEVKTGQNSTNILGGQTLLTTGILAQDAASGDDGTSAACAGALGQGGIIQIGPDGSCLETLGTAPGPTLNLNPGLLTLGARAIYAECVDTGDGPPEGFATLVDANLFLLGSLPVSIAGAPAENQGLDIGPIGSLILNEHTDNPDGSLTVRALHLTLLPTATNPAAEVIIGEVTCGIPIPDISLFSGPAIPMALAASAVVGTTFFVRRRRQAA